MAVSLAALFCINSLMAYAGIKDSLAAKERYRYQVESARQQENFHELMPLLMDYGLLILHDDNTGSKKLFHELRAISIGQKDIKWQARADLQLGYLFALEGTSDSCLFYLFEAIDLGEKIPHDSLVSVACQLVGGYYKQRRKLAEAHHYLDKGIIHARKTGDEGLLVHAIGNKALAYTWENKPDEAIALHQQILPYLENRRDSTSLMTVYMSLAGAYSIKKDKVLSQQYLRLLEEGLASYRFSPGQLTEFRMIAGFLHWELGDLQKAERILQQVISGAREMDAKFMLQRIYDTLRVLEESRNNFKKALAYSQMANLYRDSIAGEKATRHLKELEVQFQTAQKDKELAEQRHQIKQQNFYFWISLVLLVLLTVVSLLLVGYFRQKQQLMQQQLINLKNGNDLRILEATVKGEEKERGRIAKDLHDGLAGMLAAVKMHFEALQFDHPDLKESEDFKQVHSLLENAAVEVRKTAHNLMPEMLTEFGLAEALKKYCRNISNRRFHVHFFSMGEQVRFSSHFELSVYRVVQELLHNVVKHAKATSVMLQISFEPDSLTVTVEDNGIGIGTTSGGDGLGLENLKNRVASLDGTITWDRNDRNETSVFIEFNLAANK